MNCPSCQKGSLKPIKITAGLPALSCSRCRGYLLSMLSYRLWLESDFRQTKLESKIETIEKTEQAITCPKCQNFMTKYRISGETENKLDSCGNCGELWIDDGEWELLSSLGAIEKLSSILSEPWQKEIRNKSNEESYETRLQSLLGHDDYIKIHEFRNWLMVHKNKLEIGNYIARINR